jgi:hypothetical protein
MQINILGCFFIISLLLPLGGIGQRNCLAITCCEKPKFKRKKPEKTLNKRRTKALAGINELDRFENECELGLGFFMLNVGKIYSKEMLVIELLQDSTCNAKKKTACTLA